MLLRSSAVSKLHISGSVTTVLKAYDGNCANLLLSSQGERHLFETTLGAMEQLFAVRVLVHYYDKPKVDHAAVRRLLSAADVDSLQLLFSDGTSLALCDHINTQQSDRKEISEVLGSGGSSLVQVASVFMLAEARAAADALCTSPSDLETACSALERLLGCLATNRPSLPVRDIKQSARVKLGTAARRRALHRLSRSAAASNQQTSILKAVNAVLRLCDVATHCLAVVSRQSLSSKSACETAVNLSTRLLTLAASLYEVQRADSVPALSFFSSNSLRTALVSGAMHLGAITIDHLEIEPMAWIHVANRIVMSSSTSVSPRTSVLSALFGGMIKSGRRYETVERDTKAAEGAVCLLSTLHVVLETDVARDFNEPRDAGTTSSTESKRGGIDGTDSTSPSSVSTGSVSQAARSFLGERVVAAEEDGDEGRIAGRTVYQACEEYAERAGETEGMMGFLLRLFGAAGRQCRQESTEEPVVSISEGTLPCPPDESDASSDGPQPRSESHHFSMDVFDQRSKDGFGTGATIGSNSEMGAEQSERIELHREIGALALDTLAHWVGRSQTLRRYEELDITDFCIQVCKSASFFVLSGSPASYDLRAAMVDFGSLIGPTLQRKIQILGEPEQTAAWEAVVLNLTDTCQRVNPILTSVITGAGGTAAIRPLLEAFLRRKDETEGTGERGFDEPPRLPTESILVMLLYVLSQENAALVIERIVQFLKRERTPTDSSLSLSHCASCLMLLSHAASVILGSPEDGEAVRIANAALYHRDIDMSPDPLFPEPGVEARQRDIPASSASTDPQTVSLLRTMFKDASSIIEGVCHRTSVYVVRKATTLVADSGDVLASGPVLGTTSRRVEKYCYHVLWTCLMVHNVMVFVERMSNSSLARVPPSISNPCEAPLLSPLICYESRHSDTFARFVADVLRSRKQPSLILLYTAECIGLQVAQNMNATKDEKVLSSLLVAMVINAMEMISNSFYNDLATNCKALYNAFRHQPRFHSDDAKVELSCTRSLFLHKTAHADEGSCIKLAMSYLHRIGSGQVSGLLSDVITSATHLLDYLNPGQLIDVRHLALEMSQHILFVPDTFADLSKAMHNFIRKLLKLSSSPDAPDPVDTEALMTAISRVCGLSKLADTDCSSSTGIQTLCKFAHETATNADADTTALELSLNPSKSIDKFGTQIGPFLAENMPRLSLAKMLSRVLLPADESAVAVSSHAQSLSLLTKACEESELWRSGTLAGLAEVFLAENSDYPTRMVRRSVLHSATMNEGILSVFERVVGSSDSVLAAKILETAFHVTRIIFEEDLDASLEGRVRLLNFAVRLAISYGNVSARSRGNALKAVLEPELFDLIFTSLEKTTGRVQRNSKDETSKQIIIFLCGLVDCIHAGLYDTRDSFFMGPAIANVGEKKSELGGDSENSSHGGSVFDGNSRANSLAENGNTPRQVNGEPSKSSLCTYTSTGSQFVEQHWYFCYSCDLAGSEGVCSICARICHDGCELAYSKFSRFFCDCGAGSDPRQEGAPQAVASSEDGEGSNANSHDIHGQVRRRKPCQCLQLLKQSDPRQQAKVESRGGLAVPSTAFQHERDMLLGTQLQELLSTELRTIMSGSSPIRKQQKQAIESAFGKKISSDRTVENLINTALYLTKELDGSHVIKETSGEWCSLDGMRSRLDQMRQNSRYMIVPGNSKIAKSTRVLKAAAFDMTGVTSSTERQRSSGGSLMSYTPYERVVAVGDKSGFVEFTDAPNILVSTSGPFEKPVSSSFHRTRVGYTIQDLSFHPGNSNLLLVVGKEKLSVICRISENGTVSWNHVEVEVGLSEYEGCSGDNALVGASWIEDSSTLLLVVTENFVKIFDVAVDTFCPCFFSRTPFVEKSGCFRNAPGEGLSGVGDERDDQSPCSKTTVVAASVIPDGEGFERESHFFVVVLTSQGSLFVSRSKRNETCSPTFHHCCTVASHGDGPPPSVIPRGMHFDRSGSLIVVTFENGNVLCMAVAFRMKDGVFESNVRWVHEYKEALGIGETEVIGIPGTESSYMFFQKGRGLNSGGVLSIYPNRCMEVQTFSGSPSASVLGVASFGPSRVSGEPAIGGGLIVLDDGSLHRVDLREGRVRSQTSDGDAMLKMLERQRMRSKGLNLRQKDSPNRYSPVPDAIGFFEKCRPVSEHVSIGGLEPDTGSAVNYERMSVTLAGGGGDCVLSAKENQALKFSASVENSSLVLVGARMRFGGTERSRNRVPGEVKVFGRTVKWQPRNGVKRWLDIPFTVPESTSSPQSVSFELHPRHPAGDNFSKDDGYVALDSLELYAVSSIEFTERKLLHEQEKARLFESLKEKEAAKRAENVKLESQEKHVTRAFDFRQDQAALLTTVSSIHAEKFPSVLCGGHLLFEINSLWIAVTGEQSSDEMIFLGHLLKAAAPLCSAKLQVPLLDERDKRGLSIPCHALVMTRGTQAILNEYLASSLEVRVAPHFLYTEKLLFAVSGLARSLLTSGASFQNLTNCTWLRCYDEVMPPDLSMLMLLRTYLILGRTGRLLFKSSFTATMNIVDIVVARSIKASLQSADWSEDETSKAFINVLVKVLCSLDQDVRLPAAQRLVDLLDSVDEASRLIGSPCESVISAGLREQFESHRKTDKGVTSSSTDDIQGSEDSDGTQRWAYRCDSCGEVCDREWWHCNDCEDFDLCTNCLRSSGACVGETHREQHILLRGNAEEGSEDHVVGSEKEAQVSELIVHAQSVLGVLVDAILGDVTREDNLGVHWRYLDAAETISQLLGSSSPCELRALRLRALFNSSFPQALKDKADAVKRELDTVDMQASRPGLATPRDCHVFVLMLRILLSAPNSSMPVYIHQHNITEALLTLLEKMHAKLRSVVRFLCTGRSYESRTNNHHNLMAKSIWNRTVPGISYSLLSQQRKTPHTDTPVELFGGPDGLGSSLPTFLIILVDVLRVLDYSFRTAASLSITECMRSIPRNVLCDIINFSETASLHQDGGSFKRAAAAATKLLSTLSLDDKNALNHILDKYLYEEQSARLENVLAKGDGSSRIMPHETAVEVAGILQNLHRAARRHPETWRSYVMENDAILLHVYDAAAACEGQMQVHALQLLGAGVALSSQLSARVMHGLPVAEMERASQTSVLSEETVLSFRAVSDGGGTPMGSPPSPADLVASSRSAPQVNVAIFSKNNYGILDFLVQNVMLRSQNNDARTAAAQIFVCGIARSGADHEHKGFIGAVEKSLTAGLELMPYAGDIADGLMMCLLFFVACCQKKAFGTLGESLITRLTEKVTHLLKQRCGLLISHPNSRLYGRLSGIIDVTGYYLESDPCLTCAAATWEASEPKECRLDTIRAETKFTDCSIMHRLLSIHEVSSVAVKVIDPRRSRRAKKIEVFYSARTVSDAAELKSPEHQWKKLKPLELDATATEATVDLIVPVAMANIKLAFAEFHAVSEVTHTPSENGQDQHGNAPTATAARRTGSARAGETLQCPRCSRSVTDRHGICRNCHENAYQCRQCRNINYENLDGFLCNECGYCKHGRFEFSLSGRPTYVAEAIRNEEDRKRASKVIERETSNVHRCMEQLTKIRSSIIRSLTSGNPTEEPKDKGKLVTSARVGLADLLDSVTPRSDVAVLEALLEGQASQQDIEEATNSTQGGVSITEEVIGDGNGSVEVNEREQAQRPGSAVASPMNRSSRNEGSPKGLAGEANLINRNTSTLAVTYAKECRTIFATMCRGIRVLTMTRAELVRYANTVGGQRLQYANELAVSLSTMKSKEAEAFSSITGTLKESSSRVHGTVCCYGCTQAFISKSVKLVQALMKGEGLAMSVLRCSDLAKDMMLACALCENQEVRDDIRDLITYLVNDNMHATQLVCSELSRKIGFCIDSYETVDSHSIAKFEMGILEATAVLDDVCWEERLRLVVRVLFNASDRALTCSSVAESIILPCLRVALRLLRPDSELSVIDTASAAEGSGSPVEGNSSEGIHLRAEENSENENEEADPPHFGRGLGEPTSSREGLRQPQEDERAVDFVRHLETSGSVGLPHTRLDQRESATVPFESLSLSGRDFLRPEERQQTLRGGSDMLSGSGAPSSIGTAVDGQTSGDDGVETNDVIEQGIDMSDVNDILENDHDAKRVTASVDQWLEGRQSHSAWIADLVERARDTAKRQRGSDSKKPFDDLALQRLAFQRWKSALREVEMPATVTEQREQARSSARNHLSIENDNWIVRLMLFTPCTAVRKEACALLELLCGKEDMLRLQLLDILTGSALSLAAEVGENSKEFFDLLETTLSSKSHRLYLIAKGFLPRLASLIQERAAKLIVCEMEAEASLRVVNFFEGYALKRLVSLLRHTLDVIPSHKSLMRQRLFEMDSSSLVWSLQRAYICVRKLISMRTRLTDESASHLCEVLLSREFLFMGPTVSAVVSACVSELNAANERNDAQAVAILLEELCAMLCPERKEPTCLVALHKAPTQEEFIRGSMSRNPYQSSSFDGPLMRDVKNKICRDLDLPGLLEDDFAMELLVAGNLVKLDLPIMAVYEHVWRGSPAASMSSTIQPAQISRAFGLRRSSQSSGLRAGGANSRTAGLRGTILSFRRINSERDTSDSESRPENKSDPPMVVVYRLSGLDGEATEPIVDSLPSDTGSELDGEELYRDTIVLGQVGGLDILFKLLAVVGSWGDDAETAVRAPALRLLRASCEVAQNRTLLAKSPNAVGTLLDCAASAFEHAQGSPAAVTSGESLLVAAERILAQQRKEMDTETSLTRDAVHISSHNPTDVMARVRVFLGRLAVATSPTAENSILHLLPFLIQGIPGAIDLVLRHLDFSWETIDGIDEEQRKARQLGTVLLATPCDLRGNEFVVKAIEGKVGGGAIEYVTRRFPVPRRDNKAQWKASLEGLGPPLVLRVLTGLSLFLGSSQHELSAGELFKNIIIEQSQIIPVLCQLEMAVSENAIGSSAEELLEALSRDSSISISVASEREAIKKARREAAKTSRAAIMRETGLGSTGPHGSSSAELEVADTPVEPESTGGDSVLKLLEELPDEVGPSCVVCGDGFLCRPEEALAFYVYSRKVSLDLSSSLPAPLANPPGGDSGTTSGQTSGRLDWDVWSSGRTRGNGIPSRSGTNSCYATVTHLNAIHLSCHKEAARVDRSSRRDEWDGASLRNSQTKCNNLFPVRPPATISKGTGDVSAAVIKSARISYAAAVDGYFSRLTSLGRTNLSQAKAVSYDLGRGLLRFANGGTNIFSEHAKGGGPHSNACLLPHFVQLAIHLIETSGPVQGHDFLSGNVSLQTQEAALTQYLQEDEPGDLTYYLASSLVLQDLDEWRNSATSFIQRGMRDAVLTPAMLLRLIAFVDVVHRGMKSGIERHSEHWLVSFRRHIGADETFSFTFGDTVNERWENYLREIRDVKSFLLGMRRNSELGSPDEFFEEYMQRLEECLKTTGLGV